VQLRARDAPRRRRGRWGSRVGDENEEGAKRVSAAAAARPGNARDAGGAMSGTCPRRIAAAIAPVAARVIVGGGGGRRAIRGRVSLLPAAAGRGARKGRWQVGPRSPCASGGRESSKAFRT
jgi:hypothetical protein